MNQDGRTVAENRMSARAFQSEAMAGHLRAEQGSVTKLRKQRKQSGSFELIAHVTAISGGAISYEGPTSEVKARPEVPERYLGVKKLAMSTASRRGKKRG